MIPNLYIGNGCFTKHLFINGCLGFQVVYTLTHPNGFAIGKLLGKFSFFFRVGKITNFHGPKFAELSGLATWGENIPSIRIRIVMFFNAILGFSRDPCKCHPYWGGGSKNAKMYGKW